MKDLIHDNLFYVCTVIEFVARSTHNHVRDIINKLSDDESCVCQSLSFYGTNM